MTTTGRFRLSAALLVLASAALLLVRLADPPASYARPGDPPGYVHDECYQAFTAHRYLVGDRLAWRPVGESCHDADAVRTDDVTKWTCYEWIHPPLAKLVMVAFIWALGFRPFAWRLGSVVFGLVTLVVTMRLARRLRDDAVALLAGVLLASDGMWVVMSRIAMNDIYLTALTTSSLAAFHRWWTTPNGPARTRWLFATGALLGLALATKWSAAAPLVECAGLVLVRQAWEARRGPGRGARTRVADTCRWALALVALPLALYVAMYAPFFAAGYGLRDLLFNHRMIVEFHAHFVAPHESASPWWSWPLDLKPVWFFERHEGGTTREIFALGNPLSWWLFVPAMVYTAVRFAREPEAARGIVLLGFAGQWLPWAFVARVSFLQYLLPAVPFGMIAIAMAVRDLGARSPRAARWVAVGYALACVGVLVHFYPVLTGWPVAVDAWQSHRWMWFQVWRDYA